MTDPPNLTCAPTQARMTKLCSIALFVTFAPFWSASAAARTNSHWNTLVCEDILPLTPLGEAHALASRKLLAAPQPKFDQPVWRRLPALLDCT
jgi:hypothetical protein